MTFHYLEASKPANKRRKRKGSSAAASDISLKKGVSRPSFSLASQVTNNNSGGRDVDVDPPLPLQDVMIVGEPSLMGGDFGEEDERLITRLENTQYDPAGVGHPGPPLEDPSAPYSGPGGGLTPSWNTPSGTSGPSQEMELKRSPPNS